MVPVSLSSTKNGRWTGRLLRLAGPAASEQPAPGGTGRFGEIPGPGVQLLTDRRWRGEPVRERDEEPPGRLPAALRRAGLLPGGGGQQPGGQLIKALLELAVQSLGHFLRAF